VASFKVPTPTPYYVQAIQNLIAPEPACASNYFFASMAGYCANSSKHPALQYLNGNCNDSSVRGRVIVEKTMQSPGRARFDWKT
jgi:hypothetical protein